MTNEIAKSVDIHLIAELRKYEPQATFNLSEPIFEKKLIRIMPEDSNTQIVDVWLSPEFTEYDEAEGMEAIKSINLTANILLDGTDNDNFDVYVDDIGSIVLMLEAAKDDWTEGSARFAAISNPEDVELQVEDLSEPEENSEDLNEPEIIDVDAKVIDEPENSIEISQEEKQLNEADEEEGPAWVIEYEFDNLSESLHEDEEPSNIAKEVIHAPDLETAVKYAEQNARMKSRDNKKWADAEITSIKKHKAAEA